MEDDLTIGPIEDDKIFEVGDIYPIRIQLETCGQEEKSSVALRWNTEKRELELITKNATIDKGARAFFEDFRDRFGAWIVKQIKAKANTDTCRYCGK